jgi:hypothetical protein
MEEMREMRKMRKMRKIKTKMLVLTENLSPLLPCSPAPLLLPNP